MNERYNYELIVEERTLARTQVRDMIRIAKRGVITTEHVKVYSEEWMKVARRLKKGMELIDSSVVLQKNTREHLEKLEALYSFLLKMLAFFDIFFKRIIETPREYFTIRNQVLLELK